MKNNFPLLQALVAGALFSFSATPSWAQADDPRYRKLEEEIHALRRELSSVQEQHARELSEIKALLQQQAGAPVASPLPPPSAEAPAAATGSFYESMKQSALATLPQGVKGLDLDVSAVLDLFFYHDNAKEGAAHLREHLAGFGHSHGHGHSHGPENGFNLRHVELGFSAAVDPYFRAWTIVAVDEDGAELEEAVLQTTSLPYGLTLSGGKFKSGIGRMNRQHSHNWDFFDQPLVYETLFGEHGLTETGAQLTWLAPTPFYLLFGAEVFNGDNARSFAVGEDDALPQRDAPRLWTGFVKAGPNLGDQHALQFGLSAIAGRHQTVHKADECADGQTAIFGADFIYKYDAKRSRGHGDFILQGEYFYRDMDLDGKGAWAGDPWTAKQDGYYVQSLYGFLPRWRGGLRWDQLGLANDVHTPEDGSASYGSSYRISAMLDWKFSEFSLLRAQTGRGSYLTDDGRENAWEFALQWQVTFGEHTAHDF